MKQIAKALALRIPQVRHLYHAALERNATLAWNRELSERLEACRQDLESAERQRQDAELSRSAAERALAERGDRENLLERKLYVATSDLQRLVGKVTALNAAQAAAAAKAEGLAATFREREAELLASQAGLSIELEGLKTQLDATLNERNVLKHHIDLAAPAEQLTSRVTSRLSVLKDELAGLYLLMARDRAGAAAPEHLRRLYLDLLQSALVGTLYDDPAISPWSRGFDQEVRHYGRDWPAYAHTMIGVSRMSNVRYLLERIISEQIPGDLIEAGVWRGGACIYMRGILAAHGDQERKVWVADSFAGLPPPDDRYPDDAGDKHHLVDELRVSAEDVRENFRRYGLLDDKVQFLEGWFEETLPAAPIERLSLLRLDGDMYSSTIQALESLYNKISSGGFIIIDDYILPACAKAVDEFRAREGITAPMIEVDGAAIYWRVGSTTTSPHNE